VAATATWTPPAPIAAATAAVSPESVIAGCAAPSGQAIATSPHVIRPTMPVPSALNKASLAAKAMA
jgi:hypothetical protein